MLDLERGFYAKFHPQGKIPRSRILHPGPKRGVVCVNICFCSWYVYGITEFHRLGLSMLPGHVCCSITCWRCLTAYVSWSKLTTWPSACELRFSVQSYDVCAHHRLHTSVQTLLSIWCCLFLIGASKSSQVIRRRTGWHQVILWCMS